MTFSLFSFLSPLELLLFRYWTSWTNLPEFLRYSVEFFISAITFLITKKACLWSLSLFCLFFFLAYSSGFVFVIFYLMFLKILMVFFSPEFSSAYIISIRTSYVICRAEYRVKMWDPLFNIIKAFQDSKSIASNLTWSSSKYRVLCDCPGHVPMKLTLVSLSAFFFCFRFYFSY